jgi:protein quaking
MSFVILARMTGSQSVEEPKLVDVDVGLAAPEKEKLLDGGDELQSNQSTFK